MLHFHSIQIGLIGNAIFYVGSNLAIISLQFILQQCILFQLLVQQKNSKIKVIYTTIQRIHIHIQLFFLYLRFRFSLLLLHPDSSAIPDFLL